MAVSAHTEERLHGHGNTPAAWIAVVTAFIGFVVGGVGVPMASVPIVIVGAVLILGSLVIGKVMQVMGFGQPTRPTVATESPASQPLVAEPAEPARTTA